ncbi:hypothetical protein BJV82DRAFT_665671 [Fennellomyces sp. T-0311]|nr:hypothetical protein BJV82DRAFT_665671 [Fennellomyces sp. T-0311]
MKTRRQIQAETAANSLVQNAINDFNGRETTRFLHPLPTEIIVEIASYLNQQDCLTCMAVCRSWYLTVPQYLQSVWKELKVSTRTFPKGNSRWERCVRDYTKSIELGDYDYHRLGSIIQMLVDCQFREIDSLEVQIPNNISAARKKLLLTSIKKLGGNDLTQLIINDPYANMDLFDTFYTFPNLVKFHLRGGVWLYRLETQHQPILPQLIRLTHLYMDIPIDFRLPLELVLKNSPNLQYLAYVQRFTFPYVIMHRNSAPANNLDDVFSWCPKLIWLETNGRQLFSDYRSISQTLIHRDESVCSGLRSFIICEEEGLGPNQIEPHLLRNAATLEFLAIEYLPGSASLIGQSHFPRLRMLVLHAPKKSSTPWDAAVPECPMLEHLVLKNGGKSQLDLSVLKKLKQLKRLELSCLALSYNQASFQNLVMQESKISHITLDRLHSIDDMLLEAITHLSTLEQLSIIFLCLGDVYTDNGLIQFVTQLGKTSIRSLRLCYIRCISGCLLSAVGSLPTLHTFHVGAMPPNDTPVPEVDALVVLKLLDGPTRLKDVYLGPITINGTDGEDPHTFLKKKTQGYKVNGGSLAFTQREMIWVSFKRF